MSGLILRPSPLEVPMAQKPLEVFYERRTDFIDLPTNQVMHEIIKETGPIKLSDGCKICHAVGELAAGMMYGSNIREGER